MTLCLGICSILDGDKTIILTIYSCEVKLVGKTQSEVKRRQAKRSHSEESGVHLTLVKTETKPRIIAKLKRHVNIFENYYNKCPIPKAPRFCLFLLATYWYLGVRFLGNRS